MKLRTRIQLAFCITIIAVLAIVGYGVGAKTTESVLNMSNDSMTTSASLASANISQQLEDYLTVIALIGKEEALCSENADEDRIAFLDTYVEAYGFVSGNILDEKGVSIVDGTDFSDRDYVKKALEGTPNVSDITLSKYTGKYGVSIAAPILDKDKIEGVVYFRLDSDFIMDIINSISISKNSYAYLVDAEGNVVAHPNEEMILNYNLNDQTADMKELVKKIAKGEAGNGNYMMNGQYTLCGFSPIENTNGWSIVIAAPKIDFTYAINQVINILVILAIIAVIVVIIISGIVSSQICNPINKVKDALGEVAKGNLDVKIEKSNGKDEVAQLQNSTVDLLDNLSNIIGQVNSVLAGIARYDLTLNDVSHYPGEFDTLSTSVNSIKSILNQLIIEVQNSVRNVDTGSRELAQATAALSQGTVAQANSIQTVEDNLGMVVEKINLNSEREEMVNNNLGNLNKQIQTANGQMEELLSAVCEIETMSSSISKIVGTIDSIAFQTNILSLNASVEAARAGELGSGFAVVAEEVRSLAEKCSESSKKTAELISKCISSINNAKACADSTFESLSGIVEDSAEISKTFEEISNDTIEQAANSKQIQNEIHVISDVIQTNTATVEETAASTAVLSDQAMNLENMVRNFKVKR